MTRAGLYKALGKDGNPSFGAVLKVIRAMGLEFHIGRRPPTPADLALFVAGRPPGVLFGHDVSEAPQRRSHPGKAKGLQSLLERRRLSPRIRADQLVQDTVSAAPAAQQLLVDIGQRPLFGLGTAQSAIEFEHRRSFFELQPPAHRSGPRPSPVDVRSGPRRAAAKASRMSTS